MPALGDMIVRIVGDNKQFDDSIDKSEKKYDGFQKKLEKTGKNLTKYVTVPLVAAGAAMIKFAVDAEETSAKFGTAFRDVRDEADKTAKNLADNYGLSLQESEALLSGTGDLLKGFGASGEEALHLSEKVQTLSVDLASYNNLQGGGARASAILTRAMLGEREALTSLGVKVSEENVKQELRLRGQEKLEGQALLLARAEATLALVVKQSSDAQGDFIRTSDSAANTMRTLRARALDVATSFGEEMLPAFTKVLGKVLDLVEWVNNLSDGTKKFLVITGTIAATIGPTLIIMSKLVTAFGIVKGAIVATRIAMLALNTTMLTNPIFLVVAAVVALTVGFIALRKATKGAADEQDRFNESLDRGALSLKEMEIAKLEREKSLLKTSTEIYEATKAINEKRLNDGLMVIDLSEKENETYAQQVDRLKEIEVALENLRSIGSKPNYGGKGGKGALTDDQKLVIAANKDIAEGFKQIAEQAKLAKIAGEEFSVEEEKRKLVLDAINELIENGFTVQGEGIQSILSKYSDLFTAEEKQLIAIGTLTARQREIADEMLEASLARDEYTDGVYEETEATEEQTEATEEQIIKLGFLAARQREIAGEMLNASLAMDEFTDGVYESNDAVEDLTFSMQDYKNIAIDSIMGVNYAANIAREEERQNRIKDSEEARELRFQDAEFAISTTASMVGAIQNITNTRYANELAAAEGNAKETKRILREQAKSAKNYAMFDVGLKTAQAIIGFLAKPGGVAGYLLSGIAGVIGLAQIAAINSAPLPALAKGGVVMPRTGGVPVTVAEAGSPEVIFPLDRLSDIISSVPSAAGIEGDIRLQVNMDSKPILEKIFPASRNGTILIDARAVV